MTGEIVHLAVSRFSSPAGERHRLRRFAFHIEINLEAQKVSVRMIEQLAAQMDGTIACQIVYGAAAK